MEKDIVKCVGYIRVGKAEQLEMKKGQFVSFARQRGLEVKALYQDIGSGRDFNRRGLIEMMEDIRRNKVDTIVVNSISDIGRDLFKAIEYIKRMNKEGANFLTIDSGKIDIKLVSDMLENIVSNLSSES